MYVFVFFNFSNEHPIIKRSETLYDTCNPVWSTEFEFKINDKIMVSYIINFSCT